MDHMGSEQSLSAYQILSQSSDSSAVCSGCQGCCHSNCVRIDCLPLDDKSLIGLNPVLTMSPCGRYLFFAHCTAQSVTIYKAFLPLSNPGAVCIYLCHVCQRGSGTFSFVCLFVCLSAWYLVNNFTVNHLFSHSSYKSNNMFGWFLKKHIT